mgnify:CR=1 FL=1
MITKSKLAVVLAIATLGIASPAFAQYNPGPTTGSASNQSERTLGFYAPQSHRVAGQQSGVGVYDMFPQASSATNSNAPAATGGSSLGYNQALLIH